MSWKPFKDSNGEVWPYFFEHEKTGIIYFERKVSGKRITFSTRMKRDEAQKAKRFANKEFAERLAGKKISIRRLLGEEMDAWVEMKLSTEDLSESMNYTLRRGVRQLKPFWENLTPSDINQETLGHFYLWWKRNHNIQMGTAIKTFQLFCAHLNQTAVRGQIVLPAIPKIKDPDAKKNKAKRALKRRRIVTPEELSQIVRTAANEDEALVVLFMYTMATRIDETLGMEFDSHILLFEETPVYRWFFGSNKADLEGQHYLHPVLIERLEELSERRHREGTRLLFPQKFDNRKHLREQQIDWSAWRKRSDLGWHWTPHIFRHTCLSNLFNDPQNPQALICKQYRVSMKVALETYIKPTHQTLVKLRDSIEVNL